MIGSVFGRDEREVERLLAGRSRAQLRDRGILVGVASEIVEQIAAFAAVGVERIMVQWLDLDDLDRLTAFANRVLPQLA
jgi:alkanesulfonate monooxygenase SsuD/methylene tetrahydromethanopterin reductase-like flavin-dependent oxidoreductase (luciferase family)